MIVPGDVNSTLAAALCAAKLGIAVAHVESGLRSFDRTMPEEINRIAHRPPLRAALPALATRRSRTSRARGSTDERMRFVGNTMIDTLVALEERFRERGAAPSRWASSPGSYLLVTLHRPALVDGPLLGDDDRAALARSARELPVLFPVHPRTRKMLDGAEPRPASR